MRTLWLDHKHYILPPLDEPKLGKGERREREMQKIEEKDEE